MTQQLNEDLVSPANPLGADRVPEEKPQGVLEKYGLVPQSDANVPSPGNYIAPHVETVDDLVTQPADALRSPAAAEPDASTVIPDSKQ